MKKEYILLVLGLIAIWILAYLLFQPSEKIRQPAISDEGQSTTVNQNK